MPTWLLIVIVGLPLVALVVGLVYTVVQDARDGDPTGLYSLAAIVLILGWMVAVAHLADRLRPVWAS